MNTYYEVLDGGYVKLLSASLSDHEICEEARFTRSAEPIPNDEADPGKDAALIRSMIRKGHGTPFEMAVLRFEVQAPIYVKNQWFRHRTGTFLERSLRHVRLNEVRDLMFSAPPLRGCGGVKRSELESAELAHNYETGLLYSRMIDSGVPKEQARRILPLSTWTKFRWKVDLRNLLHFLDLRLDKAAQAEIREYAVGVAMMLLDRYPLTAREFLSTMELPAELESILSEEEDGGGERQ